MKTLGPLYGGTLKYWHRKALPIIEIGTTQETEYPYRKGKCFVLRAPFTHSSVYGGVFYHTPDIDPDDEDSIDSVIFGAMKGRVAWVPEDGLFDEVFKEEQKLD